MQLKNHDKIIAESLDMLRKIQSLPQYADRSLHEMSIRYLLVEKLDAADFKNVNDNLNAAAKNLETVEKYLKQFKVYDFEADKGLSSPEGFLDAVPEVQKYLEVLQQQTDVALAKLEKLDTSSDGFNKWVKLPQIGKTFEKFRDYIPLVNAASELALKSQTFAGGIVNGMKTFQQRVGRSLKPIIKKAEDAAKQGNINAQSEEALKALKTGKDSTIEQIFNLAGKNTEEEQKKAAADIRREIDGTKIKNMFNFFKNIKILPGLQKQLMAPVQAQSRQIDKMPEEMAAALMKVKIENLMDPKFFNPKLEKQDAQESVEAVKDAEEAAKELKDKAEDADKTPEVSEQESQELESKAREALKDSAVEASKLDEPIGDVISDMLTRWKNSADPLTRQYALTDEIVSDLEDGLKKVVKDSDRDNIEQKVKAAIVSWFKTHKEMLSRKGSNMGITLELQNDLIKIIPKLVDHIAKKKQEGKINYSYASIEKIVHSYLNRKYGRIISESKRLQRWQLLAGLK